MRASGLARLLGVELDRAGRVRVNRDLSVPGLENFYALGDIALAPDETGKPLPGLAQVAKQEGEYLGRALARKILRGETPKPFTFHNRGNTAIIGRHAAVFDFRLVAFARLVRLGLLGADPCLSARRFPAPPDGRDAMAVALCDV